MQLRHRSNINRGIRFPTEFFEILRSRRAADATLPCATGVCSRGLTTVFLHIRPNAVDDRLIVSFSVMERLWPPLMVLVDSHFTACPHHRRRRQRSRLFTIPDVVCVRGLGAVRIVFGLRRFDRAQALPRLSDTMPFGQPPASFSSAPLQPSPLATQF